MYGECKWVYTAYIKGATLYTYEHGVVFERSYVMYSWVECLPFFRLFTETISTATTLLWYPFCHIQRLKWVLMWQYKVLLSVSSKFSGDLKPYFYSFSCHGYLRQGSWLEATINSALSSLWQICLQTDDLRDPLCPLSDADMHVCTHMGLRVDKLGLTHTQSGVDRWMTAEQRSM